MDSSIWKVCILVLVALWSGGVFANDEKICTNDVECLCGKKSELSVVLFKGMERDALQIRKLLCSGNATREDLNAAFYKFVDRYKGVWFKPFGGFKKGINPLSVVTSIFDESFLLGKPKFATITPVQSGALSVNGQQYFEPKNSQQCPDGDCLKVFREFEAVYGFVQTTLASAGAVDFLLYVRDLGMQWDDFLEKSRSQTPLELWINGNKYRKREGSDFSRPPSSQIIFLHPGIVIENVADAISGEETEEALLLEVIGRNSWEPREWYRPSGWSIVAVYADRRSVDNVGYGVAVHFNSRYSIGFTTRDGGGDGAFISLDLLKPLQDKRSVYGKYLN